jgi:hypothetical protein
MTEIKITEKILSVNEPGPYKVIRTVNSVIYCNGCLVAPSVVDSGFLGVVVVAFSPAPAPSVRLVANSYFSNISRRELCLWKEV